MIMNAQPHARGRAAGESACRPGSVSPGFLTCGYSPECRLTCTDSSHEFPSFPAFTHSLAEQRRNRTGLMLSRA